MTHIYGKFKFIFHQTNNTILYLVYFLVNCDTHSFVENFLSHNIRELLSNYNPDYIFY